VNIDSYSIWSPNALESALAVVPYGQPDEWALAHLALLGIASSSSATTTTTAR
jgi:hypothetical protein